SGRAEGCREVAPRNRRAPALAEAARELDLARFPGERHGDEPTVAADRARVRQALDHRLQGAPAPAPAGRAEGEHERGRLRERPGEPARQAIRGDDVE